MRHLPMSVQSAASASTEHMFPWKWYLRDLKNIEKNNKTVFSCFSCGGGSSMGYKLAGYSVVGCCEIDPDMMKLYRENYRPKYSYQMDVRDLLAQDLPDDLYDLDVLDGSPPCSVFSMAGKREDGWNKEKQFREGQKLQKLDDLFFAFIDIADRLQPKIVIAENVKGLTAGNARGYVNEIFKAFARSGYDAQLFLLNSARMGVPQARERVFFVARRKDLYLPKIKLDFNEPEVTFGEVRTEHGKPFGEKSKTLKALLELRQPSDRCVADISNRVRRKNAGFTSPINRDDEPAATVTSGGTLFRMCDGLPMSVEDIINCQTFPQDYDFMDQQPQYVCGMSVPPVMMAHVAREVYEQLLRCI